MRLYSEQFRCSWQPGHRITCHYVAGHHRRSPGFARTGNFPAKARGRKRKAVYGLQIRSMFEGSDKVKLTRPNTGPAVTRVASGCAARVWMSCRNCSTSSKETWPSSAAAFVPNRKKSVPPNSVLPGALAGEAGATGWRRSIAATTPRWKTTGRSWPTTCSISRMFVWARPVHHVFHHQDSAVGRAGDNALGSLLPDVFLRIRNSSHRGSPGSFIKESDSYG